MPKPPKRASLPFRPIGPPPKGRNRLVAAANPAAATILDEIERRQQQEVNRLLSDGPATPSLGDGLGHINVDGTIELDSPERYVHCTLEVGGQAYRFPVPIPGPHYPPGQGPTVPNNSPASDAELHHVEGETEDGYKDGVTTEEKLKDLDYVASGNNMARFKHKPRDKLDRQQVDLGKGLGEELLQFLQQKDQKPSEKFKKKTEVNWFTTQRGKQVKVSLPTAYTLKDKGTRVGKIKEEEGEDEKGDDTTLVDDNSDTDSEGGVTIPLSERK